MRKEVLFAIIAGIVFGLVVALGIWRANSAFTDNTVATSTQDTQVTPAPNIGFSLSLSEPEEGDVITSPTISVTGITSPDTWVAISGENADHTLLSDSSGEFNQEVDLVGGTNQILVTVFSENGSSAEKDVTVVFSTKFDSEENKE